MKPFQPEQVKTFRAPKYGGVTLSLLSMFVLGSMLVVWNRLPKEKPAPALRVLCDEALRVPVEKAIIQFEGEMNRGISLDFIGPQRPAPHEGKIYDLYICVEGGEANQAPEIKVAVPVAFQKLVLATRKDFSINLSSLAELLEADLAFATCLNTSASGKALEKALTEAGEWNKVMSKSLRAYPSSLQSAAALSSDEELEAVFVWDSVARGFDLRIHRIKELDGAMKAIEARVSKESENPSLAFGFSRFLAAPTKGQFYFAEANFTGVAGDAWTENPELFVYCANQVKEALIPGLEAFEKKFCVKVTAHFIDQPDIAKALGLISRSKAVKSMPDLVFGSMGKANDKLAAHFDLYPDSRVVGENLPVFVHKSTRFPASTRNLLGFMRSWRKDVH
ncbi:MAG TPA: hypothetical protein DCX67_11895 [Opitutae bacterium]|nr:hypothetical protein [Opitutae bacterium]|tara:strand:+ start:5330 stop:6505 length:1176 start_codon:yes stop_codon:yes gene_type:complete